MLEALRISGMTGLDWNQLAELKELRNLRASGTGAVNLNWVTSAPNLQHLDLDQRTLQNMDALAGISSLRFLSIVSTGVSNISFLRPHHELEDLRLANCRVDDFEPL